MSQFPEPYVVFITGTSNTDSTQDVITAAEKLRNSASDVFLQVYYIGKCCIPLALNESSVCFTSRLT